MKKTKVNIKEDLKTLIELLRHYDLSPEADYIEKKANKIFDGRNRADYIEAQKKRLGLIKEGNDLCLKSNAQELITFCADLLRSHTVQ